MEEKAIGTFVGLAVGDAIGAAIEFEERDTFPPLVDMIGGGPFRLKPGEWTDDTSMALALAESLLAHKKLDQKDLIERFIRWYLEGENSSTGHCFDIGLTTRQALEHYIATDLLPSKKESSSTYSAGNATIMRLAPISILYFYDDTKSQSAARSQSRVTHTALESQEGAALLALILNKAIRGSSKEELFFIPYFQSPAPAIQELVSKNAVWREKKREQIQSTGYVIHTLEAAFWSVHQTRNFKDAVLLAANLGGDSDTVAAVTGQIAGGIYGISGIPKRWADKIAQTERIHRIAMELVTLGKSLSQ